MLGRFEVTPFRDSGRSVSIARKAKDEEEDEAGDKAWWLCL